MFGIPKPGNKELPLPTIYPKLEVKKLHAVNFFSFSSNAPVNTGVGCILNIAYFGGTVRRGAARESHVAPPSLVRYIFGIESGVFHLPGDIAIITVEKPAGINAS